MSTWFDTEIAKSLARQHVAPVDAERGLDGDPFQPSETGYTVVNYTVELSCAANTTAAVELRCDAENPPTTVVASAKLIVTDDSTCAGIVRQNLFFVVPPGFFVLLASSGDTPPTLVNQAETGLS